MRNLLLTAVLAVAAAGAAQAHAFLERAEPRVGAVIARAPAALRLTFSEGVETALCRVSVTGPPGFGGAGAVRPAPGDPTSLAVELRGPTPPGAYTVRWRVMAVDTHVSEGTFRFEVRG